MTPLARRIVEELTLPIRKRTFNDRCGILKRMDDIHCFECSAVEPIAREVWNGSSVESRGAMIQTLGFMPAPKTWIEFCDKQFGRMGFLLVQDGDNPRAAVVACAFQKMFTTMPITAGIWLDTGIVKSTANSTETGRDFWGFMGRNIVALLPFINTPRIVGRRQHMPNSALERKLLKAGVGHYQPQAWTEIQLHITPPAIDGGDHEAHLTGNRALHFCRTHIRIRLGKLELVSAHWRGDPALGMKQSRYAVIP